MTANSSGVTKRLLGNLLKDQQRRADRERNMPYAQKLRIVDKLMTDGELRVEDAKQ